MPTRPDLGEPEPAAHVSTTAVRPLGPPERVGDLLKLHADAAGACRHVVDDPFGTS